MFCYHLVLFQQVPLLHFQHLTAVVCPYGLYLGLQCFDGFFVCGYLPMQGGVLPLQSLDLVAPEKRTDTLGDVGGCGRGCPLSAVRSVSLFSPVQALPVPFLSVPAIPPLPFSAPLSVALCHGSIHVPQSWGTSILQLNCLISPSTVIRHIRGRLPLGFSLPFFT